MQGKRCLRHECVSAQSLHEVTSKYGSADSAMVGTTAIRIALQEVTQRARTLAAAPRAAPTARRKQRFETATDRSSSAGARL